MSKKIIYKQDDEIELIRKSCLLVCDTLTHVAGLIKPGISDLVLDTAAEEFIRDHKAVPGFKGYGGFSGTLCISINAEVVHGIPSGRTLRDGDIVSIDCGTYMNEFYGDAAYTFAIGEVDEKILDLLRVTKTSLYKGIEQAIHGNRIGDIGHAVQDYTERQHGYGVVRDLVGHGIGRNLHEDPQVPNFGRRGRGTLMKEGLVIAIEPMINLGTKEVRALQDGWTIQTRDKQASAHYEHTVAVRKGAADILSNHGQIEEAIKNNEYLQEISIKN
ncbi:UNVERIFIED_CONTAM: hypothetical protein GTU68_004247 [Idotea baltica]|nr:hypothetical protein [Idotea baltica]